MADPDFPTILGIPLLRSYGYQGQQVDITTTPMESGWIRRRQRSSVVPVDLGCGFEFNQIELAVFEYFNQSILKSLTSRFNIFLRIDGGPLVSYNVKYNGAPRVSKIGIVFQADCNIEIGVE